MNPANIERNKANHVAQFAAKGAPNRKQAALRSRRVTDYNLMIASGKVSDDYSGYHRPGSNK